MAYAKRINIDCDDCTKRAAFEVYAEDDTLVGRYCPAHANKKSNELQKKERAAKKGA